MMTPAVALVRVPRYVGLLRVQLLDGDQRLVQELPHRREKVGVTAAVDDSELYSAPDLPGVRNHCRIHAVEMLPRHAVRHPADAPVAWDASDAERRPRVQGAPTR